MSADLAASVAAVAAVAAALLVAWQSWETRRAADASSRGLKTANDALVVALRQADEAVRARIDAATPSIGVFLDEVDWPPLEPSAFAGGSPNQLRRGLAPESLFLPRDRGRLIMVRAGVRIVNDSHRHVRMNVFGLIEKDDGVTPIPSPVLLGPGRTIEAWCACTHTLAEWIDVYQRRELGDAADEVVAAVHYNDPADTGASDRWDLAIGGVPIAPTAETQGGWQIIPGPEPAPGAVAAIGTGDVVLRHRRYYLSKSRGEEITT
ncbi:hypothetical protein [Cellulomonas sp. HD19AZ1]|uniref:hypothetical protein n=1 Tax=Cellulomonas sp. HD19AZ1 TaxID=2559593 RepID=UPI001070FE0F|nr:hypothetical protein [Cellulomonas sp. HD19AZ1]TFH68154.1 hypothetical protein E4A51_18085 [Cellulomonas sp. HD19AZ1]